jgi:hypothetical protein
VHFRDIVLSFTIAPVRLPANFLQVALLGFAGTLSAQQAAQQPQIKVNYLNVCTPGTGEKAAILAALERLPAVPRFSTDFEIARGRTTVAEDALSAGPDARPAPPQLSRWVRIRKEFIDSSPYLNAQYTFSLTGDKADELLVFRFREPKDVLQVTISDEVESLTNPAQVVSTQTPADRIRLERFGKSSLVLARCPGADQSAYEPLFQKASEILNAYREHMGARTVVAQDLPKTAERPPAASRPKSKRKP